MLETITIANHNGHTNEVIDLTNADLMILQPVDK